MTHVFSVESDADFGDQVARYRADDTASQGRRLAMDAPMPLGRGRVRVTFRVLAPKSKNRGP